MKDKWSNYALKDGKVKSCYQREYCNRKKIRKTGASSNCDSNVQSGQVQSEIKEEVVFIVRPQQNVDPLQMGVRFQKQKVISDNILNDSWVVNLREPSDGKSKTRKRRKIQGSGEASSEVGSRKPRRRRRSSRDEEVRREKDGENGSIRKEI